MKERILILCNAIILCFLGLWDLFSETLPDLNSSGLFKVFPRVYHIIASALLLFLYPLSFSRNNFWLLIILLMSVMATVTAAAQLLGGSSRIFSLSVIFISNLVMNGTAIYLIIIKNQNKILL